MTAWFLVQSPVRTAFMARELRRTLPWPLVPACALALVLTVVTLLVRYALGVAFGERPLLVLFIFPIIVSAYVGGLWGGLVATGAAALLIDYFLIPPTRSLAIAAGHDLAQWLMLILSGVLISLLTDALHRARQRSEARREEVAELNSELEDRVQRRTAELRTANHELDSFAHSVAHDLRAPLRAIDGFSQALQEECADAVGAAGQEYLRHVRESAQHMGRLIDDLLALSRITRADLRRRKVDLSALARAALERLRVAEPARQVDVFIHDGIVAEGDRNLLSIVLDNLLGNAWKFTRRQAWARIEVGARDQDGRAVYFVRDNGAGFDMAYADKLFGVFQRLHPAHEFEGMGIGLATVQRIVQRHGGCVRAEGEMGNGATFYFTLQAEGKP